MLASIVTKSYDDNALAAKLLDAYGGNEQTRRTFAGYYWAGSWSGQASVRERTLATDLDEVAQNSRYPNVRLWARETAESLRIDASRSEQEEAERELRWR